MFALSLRPSGECCVLYGHLHAVIPDCSCRVASDCRLEAYIVNLNMYACLLLTNLAQVQSCLKMQC